MTIRDLQDWVEEDWAKASKKRPDPHLQLIFLFEELGEMAEAIRKSSGDKERKQMTVDLEGEMGDVMIAMATLANHYKVDLTHAVQKFQEKMKGRHQAGL